MCAELDLLHQTHVFRYTPAVDGIQVRPPGLSVRTLTSQIERVTALLAGEIEPGSRYDLVLIP